MCQIGRSYELVPRPPRQPPTIARTTTAKGREIRGVAGATTAPAATRSRVPEAGATGNGRLGRPGQTSRTERHRYRTRRFRQAADVEEGAHRRPPSRSGPATNHQKREAGPSGEHADNGRRGSRDNSHDLILHLEGNGVDVSTGCFPGFARGPRVLGYAVTSALPRISAKADAQVFGCHQPSMATRGMRP